MDYRQYYLNNITILSWYYEASPDRKSWRVLLKSLAGCFWLKKKNTRIFTLLSPLQNIVKISFNDKVTIIFNILQYIKKSYILSKKKKCFSFKFFFIFYKTKDNLTIFCDIYQYINLCFIIKGER
jgi:hypothetical protein